VLKLRSFRIRIALVSAILAGSALVGFGVISWWLIYNAKVTRLDAALKIQLMRAARPRSENRWEFYETVLPRALQVHAQTPIAILVIDKNGNTIYQSEGWSTDLKVKNLWSSRPEVFYPLPPNDKGRSSGTEEEPSAGQRFDPERLPNLPQPNFRLTTQRASGETWRVGAVTSVRHRVAIAVSLQAIDQEMVGIGSIFLISLPIVLILIAGGAWWLSSTALSPIDRLTTAIRQVTVKGLEQRVEIGATDVEFVELIQVFNQMLERLERNFKQASRFSGDAAHELKTPLTILQGELERAMQQAESGSEVQQSLGSLLDEVHRLSAIVRKLLLLSLADAGQMSLHLVEVNLSHLLIEMTEDIELLAPELHVQTDITPKLLVKGDRDLLVQVLQNLISNAIKYNLPNGWITIQAHRQVNKVSVTITNCSKDIPDNERDRIFDRFHRVAPTSTHKIEGTGLGLSLAREIARSHGGDLKLDATSSGQTAFTLTLRST
jgi:two-component system heavy metal sensor histidine kinase CusS